MVLFNAEMGGLNLSNTCPLPIHLKPKSVCLHWYTFIDEIFPRHRPNKECFKFNYLYQN